MWRLGVREVIFLKDETVPKAIESIPHAAVAYSVQLAALECLETTNERLLIRPMRDMDIGIVVSGSFADSMPDIVRHRGGERVSPLFRRESLRADESHATTLLMSCGIGPSVKPISRRTLFQK